MKLKYFLLLPLFLLAAASIHAEEPAKTTAAVAPKANQADPTKGQTIASTVCVACHNVDGNSTIAANPKLAGQSAEYLYKQLKSFKAVDGKPAERPNAVMMGMTSALSDEDMHNVAAWFASQTMQPGQARNKDTLELGRKLYRAGDLSKGIAACAGCHGPAGSGVPVQYPRIGGQHADYIEAQLKTFRTGERANASMHLVAIKMTDAEVKAVSDYIAGLH
jgi:cytochrome c553